MPYSNVCRCGSTNHRYPSHKSCTLRRPRRINKCKCGSTTHSRSSNFQCKLNPRVNIHINKYIQIFKHVFLIYRIMSYKLIMNQQY